ncbi:FtsX-like permease family protein [Paludisphaera mucosa]|uniref:FtsX-like permease family protein n=1 Tax=Paludisphaera mucosa TaxID=3030827 RepID=A0ABT6FKH6_9BACT|nr:FtsX-like permease family protein [Paludisphaera mucosa]MDG3008076.1 FtsX-like permease family protein [Paludisphaera mucosa]
MWRIALKMLMGDTAKFCGILLGLTFAALLIMQQGAIFCGLMRRTAGQINGVSGVDLWVMDPNVRHIDDVKAMMESNLHRVRGVEGVEWAVPLYKGSGRAKLNTTDARGEPVTIIESVVLLGLDDTTLVGAPTPGDVIAGDLLDLRTPDAIVIDKMQLPKYYPGEPWEDLEALGDAFYDRFLGREMEMNDHRATIVGVCKAAPTFGSNAVVYTTYGRAKQFVAQERKVLSFILVRTDRSWKAEDVAAAIRSKTGLGAYSSQEFARKTILFFLMNTGIVINFGITSLLGLFVGTAIAGQTFYLFTVDNLKQFGALKAMGATNARIVGMILLQAAVVGLIGYGLGVGVSTFVADRANAGGGEIQFYVWWPLLPATAAVVVFICIFSSLLCIRRVMVLEPAVVFRA